MLFATFIPDWNSLDSVRRAHSGLEAAGLVFFALLVLAEALSHSSADERRKHLFDTIGIWFFAIAVLAEIIAYPYGQRNDALSAQVIGSLDATARDAASAAERAKMVADGADIKAEAVGNEADKTSAKVASVSKQAGEIDTQLAMTKYALSARRVLDEDGLRDELRAGFKGREIAFRSYIGDEEAFWLCDQLTRIADKAEVKPKYECGMEPLSRAPMSDLEISGPSHEELMRVSQILKRPGRVPGLGVSEREAPGLSVFVGAKRSWFLLWPRKDAAANRKTVAKP